MEIATRRDNVHLTDHGHLPALTKPEQRTLQAAKPVGGHALTLTVTLPSLPWVREAIVELLKAVEPHMPKNVSPGGGAIAKIILTFSKPVPKA